MKLHQLLAVLNGQKTRTEQSITEVYHKLQKGELFQGIVRSYKPVDADGETMPTESKNNQYSVSQAIADISDALTETFDRTLTQDVANLSAKADVVVEEKVILKDVPAVHLLYLSKQLDNISSLVNSIPTLDPARNWTWNTTIGAYSSGPDKTNRSKKTKKNHVLAEATKEHPAQVQVYDEDIKIGEYETLYFSGAIPNETKKEIAARVLSLKEAVKIAREKANDIPITDQKEGKEILDFIFAPMKK